MSSYDVVIIGSGINSLTAGAVLARGGHKVAIFEKNDWFGGNIHTDETLFPGFKIDLFSGFHPLFVTGPAYPSLQDELAKHGLRYCNTDIPMAVIVPGKGSACFHTDRAQTIAELNQIFPGDGDRYNAIMDEFMGLYADLVFKFFSNDLAGWDLAKMGGNVMFSLGPTGSMEFFGRAMATARTWLDNNFSSDLTKALLAPWVLHNGVGPDDSTSALIIQVIMASFEKAGMPVPAGGGSRLVDALVAIIRENGGELFSNSPVDRIQLHNDNVTGIEVNGETVNATFVLANVTPTALYQKLIDPKQVPVAIRRQTREYRYGRGDMQIHFALDTPPNWPDERLLKAGIIHLTPGLNGVSRAVNEAVRQQILAEPTIVIGQHTALDPSRAPDGKWTIWIQLQEMPNTPQGDAAGQIDTTGGWTESVKNAVVDRVIDRIEAVAPGFRQSILHQHIISPKDLNDINPNLVGGDPYSGTCTIDQFLLWRPFKEMLPHHTPFKNLYHIGASTHPGPGLSGGSGYMVAKKIARRS